MPSAHISSRDLVVLHTLRCAGFASIARIEEACGLSEDDIEAELLDLAVAGLAAYTPGESSGWQLTEEGKAEDARRVAAELDETGAREAIMLVFQEFMALDREVMDLATAWQTRPVEGEMTPNDHKDADYDERVLEWLKEFNERAGQLCDRLGNLMERFARYGARLDSAVLHARSGEHQFVTDSTSSYRAVWFQLHEDLLVTLGITRRSAG